MRRLLARSRRFHAGLYLAGLGALALLLTLSSLRYWLNVDDAFIAFRYAENLATGHGPVFNPGERVEGYTDFLWVVLLAAAHRLGFATPDAARVMGLVAALLCLPVLSWAGRRVFGLGALASLLPCLPLAAHAGMAMWAVGGLETALYTTLWTLALASSLLALEEPRIATFAGLSGGLAYLARPEAAGLLTVLWAVALWTRSTRWPQALRAAAGFALLAGPHVVFRLAYYGQPLPNTFYAKTSLSAAMVQDGLLYTGAFLLHLGPWALACLPGVWLGQRRQRVAATHSGVVLVAAAIYIILVGGDIYPYSRFWIPYLPWLTLLTCVGALELARKLAPLRAGGALEWSAVTAVMASMAISGALWEDAAFRSGLEQGRRSSPLLESYGLWLKEHRPQTDLLAISSLGRVPYYSRLATLDMLGLADRHIAHRQVELTRGFLGHQKYDSEYVLARRPDVVALEFGTREPGFDPVNDLDTEKIYRRILPSRGWWPALGDLLGRREFRRRYGPRSAEVAPGLFFFFFERDDSLIRLEAAVRPESTDPAAHFELGMLYRKRGLLDDALRSLRRVVALDPEAEGAKLNVGFLLYEAGSLVEAASAFRRLHRELPGQPQAVYGLALSLHAAGRSGAAIPYWQRYLQMAPTGPFAARAHALLEADRQAVAAGSASSPGER